MLSKFLDPKNDVAFRKIFGTEKNKDILTVQDPKIAVNKTSIVDIVRADNMDNRCIVEMPRKSFSWPSINYEGAYIASLEQKV